MKARGTYLVLALTEFDIFYATARDRPDLLAPGTAQKELDYDLLPKRNLSLAVKSGVRIAYGTDIGEGDPERDARSRRSPRRRRPRRLDSGWTLCRCHRDRRRSAHGQKRIPAR